MTLLAPVWVKTPIFDFKSPRMAFHKGRTAQRKGRKSNGKALVASIIKRSHGFRGSKYIHMGYYRAWIWV
jgi:hypothetical protein